MRATSPALVLAALLAISPALAETISEAQARNRIEANGYTEIVDLRIDPQGIWHGRAARNGDPREVSVNVLGEFEDSWELAALTMFDRETGEPRMAEASTPLPGIIQVAH